MFNNAGVQFNGPIAEASEANIGQELTVNFLAPVLLARAFIPLAWVNRLAPGLAEKILRPGL